MMTPLFERRARGLEPNMYGEAFLRRVRVVLGELRHAGEEIAALLDGHSGAVVFGSIVVAGVGPVAQAIGLVTRRHPDIRIRIEVATSDQLLRQLAEGSLDFAIARVSEGNHRNFDFEALAIEELCVICRKTHPLAGHRNKLRLADLAGQQWVLQFTDTPLRRAFNLCYLGRGLAPPEKVIECASHEVAAALVHETDALSVLARPVAEIYVASGRFAMLRLDERITMEPYGIVCRRSSDLSPGALSVLAAIRETVGEASPPPA